MRMIFSIIGFALFIVGCQSLVPTSERTIELPTRQYQSPLPEAGDNEAGLRPHIRGADTGKEALRAIVESCRKFGRFTVKDDASYICYPEDK